MRKFARYTILAVVVLLAAVIAAAVIPATAAENNVIYISDTGSGDGSTASNPLGPETAERVANNTDTTLLDDGDPSNDYQYYVSRRLYMNSVLYQAAEKLATTGGKLVLVGDVVIDYSKTFASARTHQRDFFMPEHGNNEITITAQNDARLVITEGSYINLGGKTTFENMTIVSKTGRNSGAQCDRDLAICCGGYETVFGEGLSCIYENSSGEAVSASAEYYLSIAGTARYGDVTYDTNITIESGTWYRVYGSMYGNSGDIHRGDTKVNIKGGTFLGCVTGGARSNSVFHFGEIEVNISGGNFSDTVYATNDTGAGYENGKAYINISGGTFTASNWVKKHYGTLVTGGYDAYVTVDLSHYPVSSVSGKIEGNEIYYPAQMTDAATLNSAPSSDICYVGEEYDASGMSVSVTYTNGKSATVSYSSSDENFVLNCSNSKEGTAVVTAAYGGKTITGFSKNVSVINSPVPKILGAQISTADVNAGLRFVAEMSNSASEHITIKDYGFIAWNGDKLAAEDIASAGDIYGADSITAYGTKFRAQFDTNGIYNNDKKTTFSGVYENIQLNDYSADIVAVAYIEYEYNGKTYIRYSEPETKSVLGVANAAVVVSYEKTDWIQENIIDKYAAYVADKADKYLSSYDSENAEALRDIVVNEMNAIANYAWTPSADIDLTEKVTLNDISYYGNYTYSAGTTYYGMAYVNNSKAAFEEFETYIKTYKDGTNVYLGPIEGVNDFYSTGSTAYNDVQTNKYKIDEKYHEITTYFPASDYTGMIVSVWNKVGTNKVWLTGLATFFPGYGRGTVAVGDYDYTVSKSYTNNITSNAGSDIMYDAYAQCKRGDIVFSCTTDGGRSLYMVMEDAVAGQNTLKLMMFSPDLQTVTDSSGNVIGYTHFLTRTSSFSSLYNGGYIPVTIPELATGCQSGTTTLITGFDGEETMDSGIMTGTVVSNKQIISVNVKLSRVDDNGEFFNDTVYCNSVADQNVNQFDLSYFDMSKYLTYLVSGKEYTLTVNVDVANEGITEILSYKYTKPTPVLSNLYASYKDDFDIDFSNMEQTVIDHMKEQMDIYWTPAATFQYANLTGGTGFVPDTVFQFGDVYRGIAYSNMRATLDDFKSALSTTSTWNSLLNKSVYTLSGVEGTTDWNWVMGNHCSASMYHAYQQVIRLHASSRGNADMRLVGFSKDLYQGVAGYTNSVVLTCGNEAMYEAYAQAEKGDFVYKRASGGHTRIVQEVNVVRDETTGRIDPVLSTIKMIEHTDTLESEVYGDPSHGTSEWTPELGYDSTWWEHTYTFKLLASGSAAAIILRPTEFETNESESHYVGLTRKATEKNLETASSDEMGVVESNYPIIAVYATIETADGTVYTATDRALTSKNAYSVTELFTSNANTYAGAPDRYLYRPNYAGKSYTYTLTVELAVGKVVLDTYTAE